MSKKGIQRRRFLAERELTILDFADAVAPRDKVRKAKALDVKKVFTLVENLELIESATIDEIDMEGNVIVSSTKSRRKHQTKEDNDNENHVYNDYITDIWWLISEHIDPKDVGRFALICKKTEFVVASKRFWINLYRRFYSPKCELPSDLQIDHLKRLSGLRSRVIRFLFHVHKPFVASLQKRRTNFDILNGLQCVCTWYKQEGKMWIYCFKLFNRIKVRPSPEPLKKIKKMNRINNNNNDDDLHDEESDDDDDDDDDDDNNFEAFLARYSNIFDNRDEGCHILVVVTNRYYPTLNCLGSQQKVFLAGIRQPLARDLTHFNLEIDFSNYRNQLIGQIVYPSISSIRLVSWWYPDYHLFSNPL